MLPHHLCTSGDNLTCLLLPLILSLIIVREVMQMVRIPNIIPNTDLRQDATAIVKRVTKSREPFIITQRGRAAAVMVSVEDYEQSRHELELLRLLARGEKEIEK